MRPAHLPQRAHVDRPAHGRLLVAGAFQHGADRSVAVHDHGASAEALRPLVTGVVDRGQPRGRPARTAHPGDRHRAVAGEQRPAFPPPAGPAVAVAAIGRERIGVRGQDDLGPAQRQQMDHLEARGVRAGGDAHAHAGQPAGSDLDDRQLAARAEVPALGRGQIDLAHHAGDAVRTCDHEAVAAHAAAALDQTEADGGGELRRQTDRAADKRGVQLERGVRIVGPAGQRELRKEDEIGHGPGAFRERFEPRAMPVQVDRRIGAEPKADQADGDPRAHGASVTQVDVVRGPAGIMAGMKGVVQGLAGLPGMSLA